MARMYKSRKGQSGSTRPHVTDAPEWSNTDKEAVQSLVLDLAKSGMSTAEIGTVLRDKHAVPNARLVLGKRIGQFLAENDMMGAYPEDMMNLMRQAVAIINHLGSGNHKDIHNKRALEITESKIRRLASYYIGENRLPSDWRYKRDELRLMVE
ncbi:MAG: 30S ribosomal protein S15 [Candidatus Poseidonia sp.]|nr:30S ribosomal protein S15 [Poseidonia sp.]MEC7059333.1 30S ribosomal protein S15 [Candidatus Thermoplasmatota archaeon]MEC8708649.1 30S ribosomal protein S15 [Candidatus Thermoplasmatota archaeon]MEC8766597.1 30S ribosomal protein S15 [Candidatus Thermoplasmatota archaeon]DAC58452.1 MAG TPA: 30S ribosomal protein S15 [Candidatus Poseidoniales archaeon]